MMRRSRLFSFGRDRDGATLAEFAILLPVLALLTFAIIEFALVLWQHQQAQIAVSRALRLATTRALVDPADFTDCNGPNGSAATEQAGTSCSAVAGGGVWGPETCTVSSPGYCDPALLADMLAEVQALFPEAEASNMVVELEGAGLGFVGFGRPVPMVKVRLTGIDYQFIAIGGLAGLGDLTLPDFEATAPAEDLSGA
ncbi:hypothetical protein DDZ18_03035 [Marinicauda salina]|uniref:TadE-like domain-containing protein n=1 Tax=Marinicauda salina TaxID=2135793 RepID=A0A2U2BX44_9PROT|nr:TadE/TadG family type IV pilus assembly protein [Marinicauda salina]PWE18593.1 hypothetical protein DDZ18_03035 [Marinicauda salina]